jgi:hypothetical protein
MKLQSFESDIELSTAEDSDKMTDLEDIENLETRHDHFKYSIKNLTEPDIKALVLRHLRQEQIIQYRVTREDVDRCLGFICPEIIHSILSGVRLSNRFLESIANMMYRSVVAQGRGQTNGQCTCIDGLCCAVL